MSLFFENKKKFFFFFFFLATNAKIPVDFVDPQNSFNSIEVFETTVDGFILIAFDKTELVILPGKKKKKFL